MQLLLDPCNATLSSLPFVSPQHISDSTSEKFPYSQENFVHHLITHHGIIILGKWSSFKSFDSLGGERSLCGKKINYINIIQV